MLFLSLEDSLRNQILLLPELQNLFPVPCRVAFGGHCFEGCATVVFVVVVVLLSPPLCGCQFFLLCLYVVSCLLMYPQQCSCRGLFGK